ncbi:MAG TPA: TRAP transporter small permease subunit [Xanthobacteraceae bacterium]|jgi:TRAP-type mannitol/chloroaromatic compound transport system permease small subunit|nr:TRAP transporter small permease subunit [Xanthobacteraceae bacterium]
MPNLNFVLPHWLYWGTLLIFPLVAMYLVARQRRRGEPRGPSLFIAYLFWVCSGFMGLHRFYLRSLWGFAFIPVFLAILHTNDVIRDLREDVSRTHAAYESAEIQLNRAKIAPGVAATPEMTARLRQAEAAEAAAKRDADDATGTMDRWQSYSRWLAILMAAMLVGDAILLPGLVRTAKVREAAERAHAPPESVPPEVALAGTQEDPTLHLHTRITDKLEWLNVRIGEFVAYWAVISVFVYYYEVIARYVFNSPTNWVHESMFLMYGMQYVLCGAYAYREDQHVRVDVIYTKFSPRGKAIADIITSVFFFIFILTMTWTGARFALDAINNGEVSFTEWGIQYWPVKLALPIGAALMALQGLSKLIKDVMFVLNGRA